MLSLSGTLPIVQCHRDVFRSSLVEPPVKMSSLCWLSGSVLNRDRLPVAPGWLSQSSAGPKGAGALLAIVSPSSSKRPSSWTARAAGARANVKYCSSSESTKRADHDRARPRRVRLPMRCQSPRYAMVDYLPIPENEAIDETSRCRSNLGGSSEWDVT